MDHIKCLCDWHTIQPLKKKKKNYYEDLDSGMQWQQFCDSTNKIILMHEWLEQRIGCQGGISC